MPRIRRTRSSQNINPNKSSNVKTIDQYMKTVDTQAKMLQVSLETKFNELQLKVENELTEKFLKFRKYNNMTLEELKSVKPSEQTMMKTKPIRKRNRRSRSVSVGRNQTHPQASSTLNMQTRTISTSLPRVNRLKQPNTPFNNPPNSYGMITPKVKPNAPQVVLRRPEQGEIAISMQGSPLMVDQIVPNEKPNVNIPLGDGRVFSIQPEKGLRTSDIPVIEPEVRRQLETIRQNLLKFLE